MAVARFRKEYIASSNLRDIKNYCELHHIVYYTTLDILEVPIEEAVMTEKECNNFISEVKRKGSKLPCNTMEEYRKLYNTHKAKAEINQ